LNQLIPAHYKSFEYIAWAGVLLVLAHLCWLQLQPKSECHQRYAMATKSAVFRATITQYEPFDRIANQTRDGNLWLKVTGEAKTNPGATDLLCLVYYRTSYVLYPRRLYVGPADFIINGGRAIMQVEFNPSQQWLQEHDVRFVLYPGINQPGQGMYLKLQPVDDGKAGAYTNQTGGNR
jgi:hypothetical protein